MITQLCCVCQAFLGIIPNDGKDAISHGYCRLHELETYVHGMMATPAELLEWYRLYKLDVGAIRYPKVPE